MAKIHNLSNDFIKREMMPAWNKEEAEKGKGKARRVEFEKGKKPNFQILDYTRDMTRKTITSTNPGLLRKMNESRLTFWQDITPGIDKEMKYKNIITDEYELKTLSGKWEANAFYIKDEKWALVAANRLDNLSPTPKDNEWVFIHYLPLDILVGAKKGKWGYDKYPYAIGHLSILWNYKPPEILKRTLLAESKLIYRPSSDISSVSSSSIEYKKGNKKGGKREKNKTKRKQNTQRRPNAKTYKNK